MSRNAPNSGRGFPGLPWLYTKAWVVEWVLLPHSCARKTTEMDEEDSSDAATSGNEEYRPRKVAC